MLIKNEEKKIFDGIRSINNTKPINEENESTDKIMWLTARRVKIPLTEMSNKHLINTLNCLVDKSNTKIPENWNGRTRQDWIDLMENECMNRDLF